MIRRIGIFGGTFNPIHIAHIFFARVLFSSEGLERLFFVPARVSPFKTDTDEYEIPYLQRLHMLKIALEDEPDFYLDQFEIQKDKISYSIDTIRHFIEMFNNADIYLMIGLDQAVDFKKWKDWKDILKLVHLRIFNRAGQKKNIDKVIENLKGYGYDPKPVDAPIIDISSSYIRHQIKQHKSIKYLVPKKVEDYIDKNKLYV